VAAVMVAVVVVVVAATAVVVAGALLLFRLLVCWMMGAPVIAMPLLMVPWECMAWSALNADDVPAG